MSLQNKLNRFKKELTHVGSDQPVQKPASNERVSETMPEWDGFSGEKVTFDDQHCIVRERLYDQNDRIGPYQVKDLYETVQRWNERPQHHPLSANGRKVEDLLFFDTETTGLGTGAGNTIFLLGIARVVDQAIQVRQYFLPGPGNEVALYHHFLSDVEEMSNLVTYNGKAFDWPQVKTRHTFVRDMVPQLPAFGHFDLLHASRRVWKKSYESLRLSVVEQELLNIERKEDTPGYLAPMLYFEFLRSKDPALLKGVFEHNELDVLTLIALYTHLSQVVLDANHPSLNVTEQFEIAKWFEAVDDLAEAELRYRRLLDTTHSFQSKKALAALYKKNKNDAYAEEYWKESLKEREDSESFVELSKIYEHKYKDYDKALHFAENAYRTWKNTNRIIRNNDEKVRLGFQKRIKRLKGKLG